MHGCSRGVVGGGGVRLGAVQPGGYQDRPLLKGLPKPVAFCSCYCVTAIQTSDSV